MGKELKLNDIGVVIPVREGSSRIKNKVLLPFGTDETLLEWKINQLKQVISSHQIIVSTDSQKLIDIAKNNNVKYSVREKYLCEDHKASFNEVICGVVKSVEYPIIAWVTVVVPLMRPKEYLNAFKKYLEIVNDKNSTYDSLASFNLLKEYLWGENQPINYRADKHHTVSQDLPNIYRITNGLYMYDKKSILKKEYFLGHNPYKFLVDKVSGVDIDEIEDYNMALSLYSYYLENI
ncbi:acylneuraminate cytidylyltransferase family protein [Seonamhaeicola aphaedonensis]|uniref:N-acylneuraminate cytidylyltransferase n=1 Tax=Seonamhaeicola aphaedonensis TaxID=1461338 RepID=A0A3D9HFV3_9FLAO|nr:acylneuraminate cytidylyltransferase [Seonamhaeicola aphaedonensis]RED48369.1 N-acylneuraminate cytidylyltransferase [Seonamhaeicola aphaedonensis]